MDCFSLTRGAHTEFLVSQVVSGLAVGGIYGLIAVGLVLVYKATEVVSFAQGELLMLGAYIGLALTTLGLPYPLAFAATMMLAFVVGFGIERVLLRRMFGSPNIALVIVTLGLSAMLRGATLLLAGTDVRPFADDDFAVASLALGPILIPGVYAASLVLTLVTVAVLTVFFRSTRQGLALRAAADDPRAAMSVGVPMTWVHALSWGLSAAIAAAGGILLGTLTGVNFSLSDAGLLAFPVAILGGLDSIVGAIVGGLAIGVLQNVGSSYVDPCVGGGVKTVLPFLVLLVVLLARPHGLFGQARVERM